VAATKEGSEVIHGSKTPIAEESSSNPTISAANLPVEKQRIIFNFQEVQLQ
jgi:hypothetical protein